MASEGPILRDYVFADLAGVLDRIGVSTDPVEMCTRMRDEAVAYVREGHATGKWTQWSQCNLLTDEQDMEDDPSVEGMEGADVVACDVEDDDGPSDDDDDFFEDHGGGGGGSQPMLDVECPPAIDVECPPPSTSGVTANTAEATGHSHVGNDVASEHVLRARLLLYQTALAERDDVMMKHLRQRMGGEKRDKRDAASEAAMLLRKRGREHIEADAKRRKEELGAERLAANETEKLKLATARTQEQLAKTRLDIMR